MCRGITLDQSLPNVCNEEVTLIDRKDCPKRQDAAVYGPCAADGRSEEVAGGGTCSSFSLTVDDCKRQSLRCIEAILPLEQRCWREPLLLELFAAGNATAVQFHSVAERIGGYALVRLRRAAAVPFKLAAAATPSASLSLHGPPADLGGVAACSQSPCRAARWKGGRVPAAPRNGVSPEISSSIGPVFLCPPSRSVHPVRSLRSIRTIGAINPIECLRAVHAFCTAGTIHADEPDDRGDELRPGCILARVVAQEQQ